MGSLKSKPSAASQSPDATLRVARSLLGRALGFRDCQPSTLDAMVGAGRLRRLGKGEWLGRRGEPFSMLCVLVEGSLETSITRRDGRRHLISFLQPGDLLGMISSLDGLGHVNDLRGRGAATVLLLIPSQAIDALRPRDPALGRAFELQLAFRSRLLYERLAADPSMPLDARMARMLSSLSVLYGRPGPEGVLLDLKISQSDLGDWLGVSRQRANFTAQKLRGQGLIHLGYSTITIADPEGLRRFADT
jgi:CRP-like cAMP-binding protein